MDLISTNKRVEYLLGEENVFTEFYIRCVGNNNTKLQDKEIYAGGEYEFSNI